MTSDDKKNQSTNSQKNIFEEDTNETGGNDTTMHNNLYQTSDGDHSKKTHSNPDSDVAMNAGEARKSHLEHIEEAKEEIRTQTSATPVKSTDTKGSVK